MAGLNVSSARPTSMTVHQASRVLEVGIDALEPVGLYAVQPRFSDGHDTGIFSWEYLYFLGSLQDELWQKYEKRLADAGLGRDAPMASAAAAGGACGHAH
jgi:DUF971 family protein